MITFTIPCKAVPFARTGGHGNRRFTLPKQRAYADQVRTLANAARGGSPMLTGPLLVIITAEYKRGSSAQPVWKCTKPDIDNIAKLLIDALQGVVFKDDAQVASVTAHKIYRDADRVIVSVAELS